MLGGLVLQALVSQTGKAQHLLRRYSVLSQREVGGGAGPWRGGHHVEKAADWALETAVPRPRPRGVPAADVT